MKNIIIWKDGKGSIEVSESELQNLLSIPDIEVQIESVESIPESTIIENTFLLEWNDGVEEYIVATSIHDAFIKSKHDPKEQSSLKCWEKIKPEVKVVDPDVHAEERITAGLLQFDRLLELMSMSSLDSEMMRVLVWNMEHFGPQLKLYESGKTTNMTELEQAIFKKASQFSKYISKKGGSNRNTTIGAAVSVGKRLIRYYRTASIFM